MRNRISNWALAVLLLGLAPPAAAFGPSAQERLLAAGARCVGGPNEGDACNGSGVYCGVGECRIEFNPGRDTKVVVTFVLDKDPGGPEAVTTPVPLVEETSVPGDPIQFPEDVTKTRLTVIVEFNRDGIDYALSETYSDVTFPAWQGTPATEWFFVRDRPSLGPAAYGVDISEEINTALGAPQGSLPSIIDMTPIEMPPSADQAEESEVLASVVKYKGWLRVVDAPAP